MDKLVPITLPPGMRNTGTRYQSKNRWYTGNFVRFFQDTIQPIGGWTKRTLTGATITGVPTAALAFLGGKAGGTVYNYVAVGTAIGNLYVINSDTNVVTNITPAYLGTPPTGVQVDAGSFVVGRKYRISFVGTTDFTLIGASSSTIGVEFTATGVGAGTGQAKDEYGRVWQLASFGRHLVATLGNNIANSTSYGFIWYGDTAATAVRWDTAKTATGGASDDPFGIYGCAVTPERFLFAIQGEVANGITYDPLWIP